MFDYTDPKLILAIIASVITAIAFAPYILDIIRKQTQPHIYTWVIWIITQGTAIAGAIIGGSKFGVISIIVSLFFVFIVCILSLKFGTKNITKSDTITFVAALSAIVVWWQLENPVLAVIMVSIIDGLGYIPTFRKSFEEPWTETVSFWFLMALASFLTMLAIEEYNLLTFTYMGTLTIANTALFVMLVWRRKVLIKSSGLKSNWFVISLNF